MSSCRFDLVVYGVTGITGALIFEYLVKSEYSSVKYAVAGRSEAKLKTALKMIGERCGRNLNSTPILIADSSKPETLAAMAKRAKVIINAVGPFRLYGEAVVKAAIENGAHQIDVAGEPAWIEKMESKYHDLAKEKGVYVVGATGFDSLPCDLGLHFLKRNFQGDLSHIETVIHPKFGEAGYNFSATTYDSLLLGLSEAKVDELRNLRKKIMPGKMPFSPFNAPKRPFVSYLKEVDGYVFPFHGADKSIVTRSQYNDFKENDTRPVRVDTLYRAQSYWWAKGTLLWLGAINGLIEYDTLKSLMKKHPKIFSFHFFTKDGPTRAQLDQASFTYWFIGHGWNEKLPASEQHKTAPDVKVVAKCEGPDPGYFTTAGCVVSSSMTLLEDQKFLPGSGGVFTTASAFGKTRIYERLASFGITFNLVTQEKTSKARL
ncbi:hypothetical protein L596_011707 [Steinernema carpocapsae]|uniref:Saccharopine dehydrogenase NADP binding domain-containing protein n=1 Tax=Steinernema carpocapsae TaxID=34508 RepID=A0A4U5NVJ7_STECR|nr:hypothetical protein L596_011707 [Steinernema carpocapsae]